MAPLVWLVTATTSGLGSSLIESIVAQGDKVIATGRNAEQRLAHLKSDVVAVLDLDITAGLSAIKSTVEKASAIFGKIDVLLNNAGVSAPKTIEEADDEFVQTIFSVNLFGTLHVTQAILPYFRAQGSGTIAFMGAGVAWAPLPLISHYSASKAALDVFVEVLSKEVRSFGVRCVIFEPGGFSSKLGQPRDGSDDGFGKYHPTIADYQPLFAETMSLFAEEIAPNSPGDINKIAQRIVDIIKDEGGAQRLPWAVRVILGSDSLALIKQKCTEQLKLAAEWEETSLSTDFSGKVHVTSVGLLKASSILD